MIYSTLTAVLEDPLLIAPRRAKWPLAIQLEWPSRTATPMPCATTTKVRDGASEAAVPP